MPRRHADDSEQRATRKKSRYGASSSVDTKEQATERCTHGASSPSDTAEQEDPVTPSRVSLLHRRMLIADMGSSDIPELVRNLETISFEDVAQQAEELQAGVVLLTSVPTYNNYKRKINRMFPEYEMTCGRTDGSDFIALWHADTWKVTIHDTMQLVGQRNCLVLNIQRVAAQVHVEGCDVSPLANEDAIQVLLTKFHWSWRQQAWHPEAWRRMLELVQDNPQWIIAGALAVNEIQLAQQLKEQNCELDLCRLLSADKAITCLTCGIQPSTCESHHMKQSLIIDVPEGHREHVSSKRSLCRLCVRRPKDCTRPR